MAFDAVAVRCLVKDLKDKLINSRIDKIHQPEKDEITINLRTMKDAAGISFNVLAKMGKNEFVSMESLYKICVALDCGIDEIMEFIQE